MINTPRPNAYGASRKGPTRAGSSQGMTELAARAPAPTRYASVQTTIVPANRPVR